MLYARNSMLYARNSMLYARKALRRSGEFAIRSQ